jgi:methylthioribose-1-phosphate isomerase
MEFSPLFWPVHLKRNTIYVLDETQLPQKLAYLRVRNYWEKCRAVKFNQYNLRIE